MRVIVFESAAPNFFVPHGDVAFVDDQSAFAGLTIGADQDPRLNPMQRLFEGLARRIADLPDGVIAAARTAIDADVSDPLPALLEQNRLLAETFSRPAAAELTRRALRLGAQTRQGEIDFERILHDD